MFSRFRKSFIGCVVFGRESATHSCGRLIITQLQQEQLNLLRDLNSRKKIDNGKGKQLQDAVSSEIREAAVVDEVDYMKIFEKWQSGRSPISPNFELEKIGWQFLARTWGKKVWWFFQDEYLPEIDWSYNKQAEDRSRCYPISDSSARLYQSVEALFCSQRSPHILKLVLVVQ